MNNKLQEIVNYAVYQKEQKYVTTLPFEEFEWLVKQAVTVEKISKMPMVKGIGNLENLYNSTILMANESYEGDI